MIALTDFFCPHWWLASHQIETKELLNHWKGTSHSVFVIPTIDHPGICYWRGNLHSLLIPPFSIIFTHSYRAVLSLQLFASCVAWDPSFQEVDAWKEHESHLLLTYHQLIPPFSIVTPSKPQVSLCCIITFVFRIIMCDDPSFQEQSVCMTKNMKTWFQMFQPWIHTYKDV